ncbi:Tc toxin subunit A [Enterobacter sp.]|uniref:Tc toxin subunit A n=1 Tax=Enterobacter sp. TaxID=42895 RepID=UPI00296FFFA1|nr:Tc toxin subunit A [Enterobacter sp.]
MKSFEKLVSTLGNNDDDLVTLLNSKGYKSVFDIVRHSRKVFVAKFHSETVTNEVAGVIYDTAAGLAIQLYRQFIATKHNNALYAPSAVQGLIKNGPTWQNLFQEDWSSYCLNDAPEANDSPVSYLTWLYRQALDFETQMNSVDIITLSERRPDLPQLLIDDAAINEVVPALQLANEVLESAVTPYIQQQGDLTVDQTLAQTRFPTILPYHYPHQQTLLSLENSELTLQETIKKSDIAWPYFLQSNLNTGNAEMAWQLGSNLAPEQQKIITEPDNSLSGDMNSFYLNNLGVDTSNYRLFTDTTTLRNAAGITTQQLEALLATNAGGTTVIVSENYPQTAPDSTDYGARFINSDGGDPIYFASQESWQGFDNDEKSDPIPVVINSQNLKSLNGKFDEAIIVDATQGDEVYLPYDMSSDGSDSMDFTLAFWCYFLPGVQNMALITSNKTSNIPESGKGITLFVKVTEGKNYFYLEASDGSKKKGNDVSYEFPLETWIFVCIKQSVADKKIYGQFCTNGMDMLTYSVDISDIGNIALSGASWGFNGNKDNSYYKNYPQRESAIAFDDITIWTRELSDSEVNGFITSGKPGGGYNGMTHYYPMDGIVILPGMLANLSDTRMDKINRMVRLQRWLGLPYDKIDLLVTSVTSDGTDVSGSSSNTLRMLNTFHHYQQTYSAEAEAFAAVLNTITPYAITPDVPFFDRVFNDPSLFEEPFAITNNDFDYTALTGDDARIVRQICAGLEITQTQFIWLANQVAQQQGDETNHLLSCSLNVVSALYRLVSIPRWLGFSVEEGIALLKLSDDKSVIQQLAGVPVYSDLDDAGQPKQVDMLDTLMALSDMTQWLKANSLAPSAVLMLVQPPDVVFPATTNEFNFIQTINQQLPAVLLSESVFSGAGLPEPKGDKDESFTSWMSALDDVVDANGLVKNVTATAGSAYDAMLSLVLDDISLWSFDGMDNADVAKVITNIIWQAMQSQYGIAWSTVADSLQVQLPLAALLLQWADNTAYNLLSGTLSLSGITSPLEITDEYQQQLYQLALRAGISHIFNLTAAMMDTFLNHPDWFGLASTTVSLSLMYQFSRYEDWLRLSGHEDTVLAYLRWVNSLTIYSDTGKYSDGDINKAVQSLALLLDWDSADIQSAIALVSDNSVVQSLNQVDTTMRLKDLATKLSASAQAVIDIGALTTNSTWDEWKNAGENLIAAQQ